MLLQFFFFLVIGTAYLFYAGLHAIPEQHVGVYYRGGALLNETSEPGLRWMIPYLTSEHHVFTQLQTDVIRDIPCGTKSAVMIHFDKIEVVNRLGRSHVLSTVRRFTLQYDELWIHARIHHEMNQFCSSASLREVFIERFDRLDEELAKSLQQACDQWDTGIQIISVRVTKPRLPQSIVTAYNEIEQVRTKQRVTEAERTVILNKENITRAGLVTKAQSDLEVAIIHAKLKAEKDTASIQQRFEVSKIAMERIRMEKFAERDRARIEAKLVLDKASIDAKALRSSMESKANSNKKLFTPSYLEKCWWDSVARIPKSYYGSDWNMLSRLVFQNRDAFISNKGE